MRAKSYYPGAVSFIQRFGGALNLNVHIHSQISDGVYARLPDNSLCYLRTPPPKDEEIKKLTLKIAHKIHSHLEKLMQDNKEDILDKEPLLAKCYAASIRYMSAIGQNAGKPLLRSIDPNYITRQDSDDRTVMGFNLHASKAIEAIDRNGLERTLRYMGRPPLSKDRLKLAPDNKRLILTLKTPWRNGTDKIFLTPFELLERLVALIPKPRKNQIRYHGFLAPHSKIREKIIKSRNKLVYETSGNKICRPEFARLMARVFEIDVLKCPRCQSKMQLISFMQEPKAIRDILISLKMGTARPIAHETKSNEINDLSYHIEYIEDEDLPSCF